MSFILDAIKKSEKERNRRKQPDVHSIHRAPSSKYRAKSKKTSAIRLIIALVIIGFGGWWLYPKINVGDIFQSSPFAQSDTETTTQVADTNQQSNNESQLTVVDNGTGQAGEFDELPPYNQIKELWQLPSELQSRIPSMDFSFHVYSENVEDRTIIINDRRIREGQLVASGLRLREITETGVILYFEGRFFHIDVIEKW